MQINLLITSFIVSLFLCSCSTQPLKNVSYATTTGSSISENAKSYDIRIDSTQKASNLEGTHFKFNITSNLNSLELSKELMFHRPELTVVDKNETIVYSNRNIYFKKVENFRDLGGYFSDNGRQISWGKIYRSNQLYKLKDKEFEKLNDLGIKTVIDLRTNAEISKKPDHLPDNIEYLHYAAFSDESDQLDQTKKQVLKGEISVEKADSLMKLFYATYLTDNPEVIKNIVTKVLDSDTPVVFHCTSGKDRTGMISALLLTILKVNQQEIDGDYILSNNYRNKSIEKRMNKIKLAKIIYPHLSAEVLGKFSYIETDYLQAAFDAITKKYGSVDNYIHQALGIDEKQRAAYIAKFTTK